MLRTGWMGVALVVGVWVTGCSSESAGGSGSGGGASAVDEGGDESADLEPCDESTQFCETFWWECPCEGGFQSFTPGCFDSDDDGVEEACMTRAMMCASRGCPLDGSSGSGAGGAPSTGSGDTASGAGPTTGSGPSTGSGDTSSGSGTPTHPECEAYGDGHCACGYQGQCAEGQREEVVDFCNSFFDTPYMQCSIGCVTGSGTCAEKGECINACDA